VPVDPLPSARVVGSIPHFRKLAFLFGVVATALALLVATQIIGSVT
jgi:hypothetical protein